MIKAFVMIRALRRSALLLAIIFIAVGVASAADILRVDKDVVGGTHDGSSWANAFSHLQDALDVALSGEEIWVAEGTYLPVADDDGDRTPTNSRDKTFKLVEDVAIYGGFIGNDTGGYETARGQRGWKKNVTILSGDLDGDDDPTKALNDPPPARITIDINIR